MALVGRDDTRLRLVFLPSNCQIPYKRRGRVDAQLAGDTAELTCRHEARLPIEGRRVRGCCELSCRGVGSTCPGGNRDLGENGLCQVLSSYGLTQASFPCNTLFAFRPCTHSDVHRLEPFGSNHTCQRSGTVRIMLGRFDDWGHQFAVSCGRTSGAADHLVRQDSWRVQRRKPAHSY